MSHILVVDDEPFIVRSLAFMLRKEGHEVSTAKNGQDALQLLREQIFDLAFIDIMMPKFTGFEVLEQLKQDPGHLPSPVVFLTAKGMDEDRERGIALGASEFLLKPFSPSAIISLIHSLCSDQSSS